MRTFHEVASWLAGNAESSIEVSPRLGALFTEKMIILAAVIAGSVGAVIFMLTVGRESLSIAQREWNRGKAELERGLNPNP